MGTYRVRDGATLSHLSGVLQAGTLVELADAVAADGAIRHLVEKADGAAEELQKQKDLAELARLAKKYNFTVAEPKVEKAEPKTATANERTKE